MKNCQKDDAGRIVNSAELLFGKKPQRFFISSEVKCMQFFADKVSKPMADYQVYRGDVFELVDQATHFVMTHIRNWSVREMRGTLLRSRQNSNCLTML